MPGLLRPIIGHDVTQGFAGHHEFEAAGFLTRDQSGPRRGRSRNFQDSTPVAHLHGAVDIKCPPGTPVLAPERGTIVKRGRYTSTGEKYLMLQIRPGTILFFTHLRRRLVHVGDTVMRGQQIALTGNTGMTTGPHLHWEVRITKRANPKPERSGRWFKWNPQRLQTGGNLMNLRAIRPLNEPAPTIEIDADDEPDEATDPDPMGDAPDDFGDAAALIDGAGDPDDDPDDDPSDEVSGDVL